MIFGIIFDHMVLGMVFGLIFGGAVARRRRSRGQTDPPPPQPWALRDQQPSALRDPQQPSALPRSASCPSPFAIPSAL